MLALSSSLSRRARRRHGIVFHDDGAEPASNRHARVVLEAVCGRRADTVKCPLP